MWAGGRKEGDQSGGSGDAFGLISMEASTVACWWVLRGALGEGTPREGVEHLCPWGRLTGGRPAVGEVRWGPTSKRQLDQ